MSRRIFGCAAIGCLAFLLSALLLFAGCAGTEQTPSGQTPTEEERPVLTAEEEYYELDLSEEEELVLQVSAEPAEAEIRYDLHGQEGVREEGGTLTFSQTGRYEITVNALYEEKTDSCTVEVFVYDQVKLEGDGSSARPYRIASADDLAAMAEAVNGGADFAGEYFTQTADISLEKYGNWTPIGTNGIPFEGIYDGQGRKIEDLTILSSDSFQGLFGFVTGTVKNVSVYGRVAVTTLGSADEGPYAHSYAGGIAGGINNGAVIESCVSYVNVLGDSFVGGIVGEVMENDYMVTKTFSSVVNCVNYGNIRAIAETAVNENAMYYGGIAGRNNGIVRGCVNYGSVSATAANVRYVGGIAGYGYLPYKEGAGPNETEDFAAFENCENYGTVQGVYGVGGIVGQYSLTVKNCFNYAAVSGENCVGGIAGIVGTTGTSAYGNTYLQDCENEGEILCTLRNAGGIAGYSYCKISGSVNRGAVGDGTGYQLGGIAGYTDGGNVENCTNEAGGKVLGLHDLGGIVGRSYRSYSTIKSCTNAAAVVSTDTTAASVHIGGIVGMLGSTNAAEDCTNSGAVTGVGSVTNEDWGGVAGIAGSMYNDSAVRGSMNSGRVAGSFCVGGIVGFKSAGVADGCENTGAVGGEAASYAGGVVGNNSEGNISGCANDGPVTGAFHAGGIVGRRKNGDILQCDNKEQGTVTGEYRIGGIVGTSEAATADERAKISGCTNAAAILSTDTTDSSIHIGGIVGMHGSYNTVENCENSGAVTGVGSVTSGGWGGVGGISGSTYTASLISGSSNGGTVAGSFCVGGIVGYKSLGTVEDCENTGTVGNAAAAYAGGIAGCNSEGDISACVNNGPVTGAFHTGGIAGRKTHGNIVDCDNEEPGTVTGEYRLGGIVGTSEAVPSGEEAKISGCTNAAAILSTDTTAASVHIGGIVGMHGSYNTVENCENSGAVSGRGNGSGSGLGGVGGISGSMYTASVLTGCTNRGAVSGSYCVGGVAGYGKAASGKLQSLTLCENYGEVVCNIESGSAFAGGILGYGSYMSLTENGNYGACRAAEGVLSVGYIYGKIDGNSSESGNVNYYTEA